MAKMFDSPLVTLFVGYSAATLAGLAGCLVGASVYDLKEAKLRHKMNLHPYSKQNRHRPLISVVIYTSSPQQLLVKCLESIRQNSYRNYQIIVVDDTGGRGDEAIKGNVLAFSAKYPKIIVHMLRRRKKSSWAASVESGIKKWARSSELIMNLDAGNVLDKHALRCASQHFTSDNLALLVPNAQVESYPSVSGVFQQLDQLLRLSTKKLMSLLGFTSSSVASAGVVYRRLGKPKKLQTTTYRIKYGSDVLVYTSPAGVWASLVRRNNQAKTHQTTRVVFDFLSLLFAVLTPCIITYLLYLSVYFKQSALYGLSWVIFSVVLFSVIWGKDHLSFKERLRLTALIPIMYAVFYMRSVFQIIVLTASSLFKMIHKANKSLLPEG